MLAREEEKQEEEQEQEQEQVRLLHLWTFLLILAFSIFCMLSEGRHGMCSSMMGQSNGNPDQTPRDGRLGRDNVPRLKKHYQIFFFKAFFRKKIEAVGSFSKFHPC